MTRLSIITIVAGEYDLTQYEGKEQIKYVQKLIIHRDFHPVTKNNDICVIVLKTPFELNENVQVSKLPRYDKSFSGEKAVVYGWGKTGKQPHYSEILLKGQFTPRITSFGYIWNMESNTYN